MEQIHFSLCVHISHKEWVKADGTELKMVITSVDEFVENSIAKLSAMHSSLFHNSSE